ncbi:hypothetical protein ACFQ0F_06455 [Paraperlucidibaca wandonensis]|uniref:SGNH/GDSL hydrolase family protein n=1 Tax=Paraperlucidibaca wandonensis TaxID=1268273 RepID=A0ABW3HI20_9GAMM
MNALFLTDSLGYPRVDNQGTSASEVWTYTVRDQAQKKSCKVSFFFDMKPFRDTRSLLVDVEKHCLSYSPDLIILQVGIVDCYPRALTKIELQVVSRLPIINQLSKAFVKKYYKKLVRKRNIAYVPLAEYKQNLIKLKEFFPKANWLVIPIAPASQSYMDANPLISSRIEAYNAIQEVVFSDAYKNDIYKNCDLEKVFLEDNHHLSKYGHKIVSSGVFRHLHNYVLNKDN